MKFKKLLQAISLTVLFPALTLSGLAQTADGFIKGRVVTENGQPIPYAMVNVFGVGGPVGQPSVNIETVADEEGNFSTSGLPALPYLVSAWSPGYVPASNSPVFNPFETSQPHFVNVGEVLTVQMIRGGVITGRVTNEANQPVVGAPVRATRIKDESGASTEVNIDYKYLWTRTTDDRGIYRIYGLAPGSYIVGAGGRDNSSSRPTPFAGRMTTYHPSSTRDAATLINVSSGIEAANIDIRYRGEKGFAISGKINGASATQSSTTVYLRNSLDKETIATTNSQSNNRNGYAFYGIPNGNYEVIAKNDGGEGENGFASIPRSVNIKESDLNGVDITLLPNATLLGAIVILTPESEMPECRSHRKSYPEEVIVRAKRDEPSTILSTGFPGYGTSTPNGTGFFTINNLTSGMHHIELELPDKTWYLKTMAMTGSRILIDPREGLNVKGGDKLRGLTLTIAQGAAVLKGKVIVPEGSRLPAELQVVLVPAETESIDDILRYVSTSTKSDGTFSFSHLAPGQYLILTRLIPKPDLNNKPVQSARVGATERKKLRREAETANLRVELKPCSQITDYALPLINPKAK
jgi:hypothetical protein